MSYGYFFQGGGGNQNSRICLTRAIIEQQTFTIDHYLETDPRLPDFRFVNTKDWSYKDGNYYINKSPGLPFLALVPYGLAQYILQKINLSNVEKQIHVAVYVSTLFTADICGTFLCLLLFHLFYYFLHLPIYDSLLLTIFFGFGTFVFPYSTAFYSHIPSAFFSFLAFIFILYFKYSDFKKKKMFSFFSGFFVSASVLIEPTAIFILALILIWLIMDRNSGKRYALFFLIGCIPMAIVQVWYNFICFGNPMASSYLYANKALCYG